MKKGTQQVQGVAKVDELKVDELEEKVAALEFDLEWQRTLNEKRLAVQVVTVSHDNVSVNRFLLDKPIDFKNDSLKDVVRKGVHRGYSQAELHQVVLQAYLAQSDRSKTQKETKSGDPIAYAQNRMVKILGDILKEDFAIKKLGNLTVKGYFKLIG